ncbi:tetratricopeptide repeat-containing sulfotransferase family protein [Montanilutibacter psychrotolerans]|uniref:Sulfotransferase family protein n=1 Tax=Montanilutibacter psychrotolerans TaxID=1327343 RepID=A0A3M8SR19_9GAMM|nr:sulfotransferase [Lysobacter psychrotolerans]RNF83757.1 sulfotransferase family protein [Lysobacter psychrotolerans]
MRPPTDRFAATARPGDALASWQRAQQALAQRDLGRARAELQATLAADPTQVQPRVLLAGVMLAGNELRSACAQLLQAARRLPRDAATVCRVAQALMRVGETTAVRDCLAHPAIAHCQDGATLASLAHLHQLLGQHRESLALMDRARAGGYDNADFRYFRAIQLQFNGRLDEAAAELEACLQLGPSYGRAWLTLARLRRQSREHNHIDAIRAQRSRAAGDEDRAACEFALYKEHEDLGELDDAWQALQRANALMHARLRHDPVAEARLYNGLAARCDADLLASHREPEPAADEGPQPIFIIGLPRSGTTVLDRILGNHPDVVSAGELGDFGHQLRWSVDLPGRSLADAAMLERLPSLDLDTLGRRYLTQSRWRAGGCTRYVDKLPANFVLAGLIAPALPRARLLHLVRAPMDVCFSNYRALFGDAYAYSYDLATLASHHRNYRQLMAHWHTVAPGRILDVDYQQLVAEPERVGAQVLAFCGLPAAEGISDLASNTAPVATLSAAQVREPIHSRGVGEWRRYEAQLQGLRELLGDDVVGNGAMATGSDNDSDDASPAAKA